VHVGTCRFELGSAAGAVQDALADWQQNDKVRRLWNGDPALWTGADEDRWLGWLHILDDRAPRSTRLMQSAHTIRDAGFQHVVVLGMGGSSLCPEVMSRTFGPVPGFPTLLVLDSTDPRQIRALDTRLDPARTLFVVSSKSGGTTETNVFFAYFHARVLQAVGAARAATHFVAITDPGTTLEALAHRLQFREILHGIPSIGGRYSALSDFGMAPAAWMGVDMHEFLGRAARMAQASGPEVRAANNPGVGLGVALGVLGRGGRDKLTLVHSAAIAGLGAWIEQLVAESTGKHGIGLVPVDDEPLGPPSAYGRDRVFVATQLAGDSTHTPALAALEAAGHPVVRITLQDKLDLGQEFLRWEIATAVAGAVLGIHPFDQPDVEASKVATRALTTAFERDGHLPAGTPLLRDGDIDLFADDADLTGRGGATPMLASILAAHMLRLQPGDYFAILAYLPYDESIRRVLQALRLRVRDRGFATTLGFGPRFLHSTGQLHKGGPGSGVFLQITAAATASQDLPIPERPYGFGLLESFQAAGDFSVLQERRRRALRVHLNGDISSGLARLSQILQQVLRG